MNDSDLCRVREAFQSILRADYVAISDINALQQLEWAIKIINNVLCDIMNGELDMKQRYIIDRIGEPIMQRKLNELYMEKNSRD